MNEYAYLHETAGTQPISSWEPRRTRRSSLRRNKSLGTSRRTTADFWAKSDGAEYGTVKSLVLVRESRPTSTLSRSRQASTLTMGCRII